jgi:FlgD Ig-like domain
MRLRTAVATLAVLFGNVSTATARTNDVSPTFYVLEDRSDFETGCFGPCDCAVVVDPLRGRFELKHTGFDGLFDHYEVTNVKWVVLGRDPRVDINGSGKYMVGGEFAIQQRLSLDLKVADNPVQHFDSGLVPGQNIFPKIDITISVHDMMACVDTVMRVVAVPTVAGVEPGGPGIALGRVKPNPFRAGTDIDLTLRTAGKVDLAVYDPQGRLVRSLARGTSFDAGPHSIAWDGRRADGAACAPGLYFVQVRAKGGEDRRVLVKLE